MLNCWAHRTARARPPAEAAVDPARAASDIPYPPLFSALSFAVYATHLWHCISVCGAAVDCRVHLLTQQQRNRRKVEVDEQRDGCAQASVDHAIVGEV